jgi:hypothetical protein
MINALFDTLDVDGSGVLDMDDIPEDGVNVSHLASPRTPTATNF